MKRLAEWLQRLHRTPPDGVREHLFRTVTPGFEPPSLRDSLIALQPLGQLPGRPGESAPSGVGLLRFLDTNPIGEETFTIATEIAAVVSLVANRRFEVAMELPISAPPSPATFFLGYGSAVDRTLIGSFPSDFRDVLSEYFERIQSLSGKDLDALGAACKLHHGSVLLVQNDARSAYVLLVAALEVLSQRYGDPPSEWGAWERSTSWDKLFEKQNVSVEHRAVFRNELLRDRHLRLKATFRSYGARLPESFWSNEFAQWNYSFEVPAGRWGQAREDRIPLEQLLPRDSELLSSALGHTYDLRSGVVHRGEDLLFAKASVRGQQPVSAAEPLPYAVLRAIVVELIRYEFKRHSEVRTLPKYRMQ